MVKNITLRWKVVIGFLFFYLSIIPVQADNIEDYLNNVLVPEQQYSTYLSSPYLKTKTTEENIAYRSGELSIAQTDYVLPGRNGLDVILKRIYKNNATNLGNMQVKYVNGALVDYVDEDVTTTGFYERRYNLGLGMRFSFETLEIPKGQDNTILFHTETGDVYTLKKYMMDDSDREEWFKNGIDTIIDDRDYIYLPRGENVKEFYMAISDHYTKGTEKSKYVLVKKDGLKLFFAEDGRLLAKKDRYDNTITFDYTTLTYQVGGQEVKKVLIHKITDTIGRVINIDYREDHGFRVKDIGTNTKKSLSYEEMQNPNLTQSGDLEGKYKVVITLPDNKTITYVKSAALVTAGGEVVRTRLQTVYDRDDKAKYHYWYEQPSLGFTFHNGTTYTVYNRYEYLTQVDYCKTNEMNQYTYQTFKKKLYKGSMEYRKLYKREKLVKTGLDSSQPSFMEGFLTEAKEKEVYTYSGEPDGFGESGYSALNRSYLKNTYRYATTITDSTGNRMIKTYDGLHELIETQSVGQDHKTITKTSHDDLHLINKKIVEHYILEKGKVVDGPLVEIENYRYDKYGNLTNYTGVQAERNEQGEPVNEEHTVTYTYDYDRYHSLRLKTWKQDKKTTCQRVNTLGDKGNILTSITKTPIHPTTTKYTYDVYGNITSKEEVGSSTESYTEFYEYGTDLRGVDYGGAYLTKTYQLVDGQHSSYTYAYDQQGNLVETRDPLGYSTQQSYDVLDRLIQTTYPDNTTSTYTYEEQPFTNLIITTKDRLGNKEKHTYDIKGKELSSSYLNNGQYITLSTNRYNTYGLLTETQDGKGNRITYTYTSDKKVKKKQYYHGSTLKEKIQFSYTMGTDHKGLITQMMDEDGYHHKFFYDMKGQLVQVDMATGQGDTYQSKTYAYDYTGHKIEAVDPMGNKTQYIYDRGGRLYKSIDPLEGETTYYYNGANLLIKEKLPDQKIKTYVYDAAKRLKETRTYLEGSDTKYYTRMSYDRAGNLTEQIVGKATDAQEAIASKTSYSYNQNHQVEDEYQYITDTLRNHHHYNYDANGNLLQHEQYMNEEETDYLKTSYSYNEQGLMVREIKERYKKNQAEETYQVDYTYDIHTGSLLEKRQVTEDGFKKENYHYDYRNRLVKKILPQDASITKTYTFGYDNRGNLLVETLTDGTHTYRTVHTYDALSRRVSTTDASGAKSRYLYDENGNLIKEIDPRYSSETIEDAPGIYYAYDKKNRMVEKGYYEEGTYHKLMLYAYDARDNITKKVNALGIDTSDIRQSIGEVYTYNALDQIATKRTPEGIVQNRLTPYSYTYDGMGRLITQVDPRKNTTHYTYDYVGRLIGTTYADGSTITQAYDLTGMGWSERTDQIGNKTRTTYNIFQLPVEIVYPDGSQIHKKYTPDGLLKEEEHSLGAKSIYSYDQAGNLIQEKNLVDVTDEEERYRVAVYTYDVRNLLTEKRIHKETKNLTTGIDTLSDRVHTQSYTYDLLGRLLGEESLGGTVGLWEYDQVGNLITQKNLIDGDNWQITRQSYNLLNQMTKKSILVDTKGLTQDVLMTGEFDEEYGAKLLSTTSFAYDGAGNIIESIDPLGNRTTYKYDLESHLIETSNPLGHVTKYRYNVLGQLIVQESPLQNTKTYIYDSMGRIVKRNETYQDKRSISYTYHYDQQGKLVKEVQPKELSSGEGITYTYNNMGRNIGKYTPDGQQLLKVTYDAMGRIIKKEEGQHIGTDKAYTYAYDYLGQVLTIRDPLGNTTEFTYDIQGNLLEKKDPRGALTGYSYDADNRLIAVHHPEEISEGYTYDKLGRMLTKTDGKERTYHYVYNAFGKVIEERDPLGNKRQTKYDMKGQALQLIDQQNTITTLRYNQVGKIIGKEIPQRYEDHKTSTLVEEYRYNEDGRLISFTSYDKESHGDLRSTIYTYYRDGRLKTRTTAGRETTSYTYDKNGNIIEEDVTYPDGSRQRLTKTYDQLNRLVSKTRYADSEAYGTLPSSLLEEDRVKLTTTYGYDLLGNVIEEVYPKAMLYTQDDSEREKYRVSYSYDPLNRLVARTYRNNGQQVQVSFEYDANGNKVKEINEAGQTRSYSYNANNLLKEEVDPLGHRFTYTYDRAFNLTELINPKGQSLTYTYDALNRRLTATNAYGHVIERRKYDKVGNIIVSYDPLGNRTTYTYDLQGRVLTEILPETKAARKDYTTKYTYNIYGDCTSTINVLGETTKYIYDTQGQLLGVEDARGVRTTYTYNDMGHKVAQVDGNGHATTYRYSEDGYLLEVTNPLGYTKQYTYDLNGQVVEEQDYLGHHIRYTYDNLGRLVEKQVKETGEAISYSYDFLGNRIEMVDDTGTSSYTYDANNQLTYKEQAIGQPITYTYDALGNISSIQTGDHLVAYTYDQVNRLETVDHEGNITTYHYDSAGNRSQVDYPNQVSTTYTYNKENRVTGITHKKGSKTLSRFQYTYDLLGRKTSRTNHMGITNYTYDSVGRLAKEIAPGYTTRYTYDSAGNRIIEETQYRSDQQTSFVDTDTNEAITFKLEKTYSIYNEVNQLIKSTKKMYQERGKELLSRKTSYIYDKNGNQLSQYATYIHPHKMSLRQKVEPTVLDKTSNNISPLINRTTYAYDGFNRLVKVEKVEEGRSSEVGYRYDGEGLRVEKMAVTNANGGTNEKTIFTYDRQHVITETTTNQVTNDTEKVFYVRGLNHIARASKNGLSYYLHNGHGDVVQTTDEEGNIQNQYTYDAFGNEVFSHEEHENAIRYSGEYYDKEVGLYYLRARYYNPSMGRFISEDSYWGIASDPSSLNLYTYCKNDPINFIDPSGHSYKEINELIKEVDGQKDIWRKEELGAGAGKDTFTRKQSQAHKTATVLYDKLAELDDSPVTKALLAGASTKAGAWERYKRYMKTKEMEEKEEVTPHDVYEYTKISTMVDIADEEGRSISETLDAELVQEGIERTIGANIEVTEGNDIIFHDRNETWKYVGEDTNKVNERYQRMLSGIRSKEQMQATVHTPEHKIRNNAESNLNLDLSVNELKAVNFFDHYGVKDYLTSRHKYGTEVNAKKKQLREELYKAVTGKEVSYYEHKLFNGWADTDRTSSNWWSEVRSSADMMFQYDDWLPDDMIDVAEVAILTGASIAAIYTGGTALATFLDGVAVYGFSNAVGFVNAGTLKYMLTDYMSTTDADEQFIINALNSTDADEQLVAKILNSTDKDEELLAEPEFGKKLDYLFGKATGNQHNLERTAGMESELAKKMGIIDTPENRKYIMQKLRESYYDPSSVVGTQEMSYVAKELPDKPTIYWTGTTRETYVMGPNRGAIIQTLWDDNVLKNIIVRGGKGVEAETLQQILNEVIK